MNFETFDLPSPLPDRLPDESNSGYRRRVIPGHSEWEKLSRIRQSAVTRYIRRAERRAGRHITVDERAEISAEANRRWRVDNPQSAQRLDYLSEHVRWVSFG